jgi:sugar phosphate isomerase/epimerase
MNHHGTSRREFLAAGGLGTLGLAAIPQPTAAKAAQELPERKFYMLLSCGRIGAKASFRESVDLAVKYGFEGIDPSAQYFSRLSDDELKRLLDELKAKNLKLGAAGLPVDFRKDEATFNGGLKKLPAVATTLEKAGVTRVSTWIMPCSNELTYPQNFRSHACRLRSCATVLQDHGQRLGLEYVSPKTLWTSQKQPFLHTLSETKELLVAIGTDNLGVQLDSWHWFNAGETEADLLALRNQDVVTVDLNDAPAGIRLEMQVDSARELPAATGVIPVKSFLDALRKIGYDGPVQAEPFNAALRAMPTEQAVAATAVAMKKALAL